MLDKRAIFTPSQSKRVYAPTDKLPELDSAQSESLYSTLAGWIGDKLGPEGGTPLEIYKEVLGPKGLSQQDTNELIHNAKKLGYLK